MSLPAMNCPRCGIQFDYTAQFCSGCGERVELQRALCDFVYGDLSTRIAGASVIARLDQVRFGEIATELEGYLGRLEHIYALDAAVTLQKGGVRLPKIRQILLDNLKPDTFLELSNEQRWDLLEAVSNFRNDPVVAKWLIDFSRDWYHFRETIFCLLASIGDATTKSFVQYWASRGERAAVAALRGFGKSTIKQFSALFSPVTLR